MTAIELFRLRSKEVWNKIYALINWKNRPSTTTALGATNLNKMDVAINTLDNRVIQLQTEKLGNDFFLGYGYEHIQNNSNSAKWNY